MTVNKNLDKEKPLRLIEMQREMSQISYHAAFKSGSPQKLKGSAHQLKEQWFSMFPTHEQINQEAFDALETVCGSELVSTQKGLDVINAFFNLINETVFAELNKWLNIYIYIYS